MANKLKNLREALDEIPGIIKSLTQILLELATFYSVAKMVFESIFK